MGKAMTIADHQASRYIVDPSRLFDCALESDGGGAVPAPERGRDYPRRPVAILGMGQHHPHFSLMDAPSLTTLGARNLQTVQLPAARLLPALLSPEYEWIQLSGRGTVRYLLPRLASVLRR